MVYFESTLSSSSTHAYVIILYYNTGHWKILVYYIMQIFLRLTNFMIRYFKIIVINIIMKFMRKILWEAVNKLSKILTLQMFSLAANTISCFP